MISSVHNKRVAKAIRLKKRAMREKDRRFLVEGAQAVFESIASGARVREVFHTTPDQRIAPAIDAALEAGVSLSLVSEEVMAHLTSTVTPQGVVAVADFVDVGLDALDADRAGIVPVLAEVRDPGNAGTILRSADASGADAVVFSTSSVDVYNSKAVRASAGSLFHVPVVREVAVEESVAMLRARGFAVYAAASDGDLPVFEADLTKPAAVILGNEARGLRTHVRDLADATLRVPIAGNAESLNLAAAATVILFEAARQRAGGDVLSQIVGGAAHDIRSPLTALGGFAKTLVARWAKLDDEQRLMMLEGVTHDAARMEIIVTQLVEAARLTSHRLEISRINTDLLEAAMLVRDELAQWSQFDLEVAGEPVRAFVDPARLRTILIALIESAQWWGEEGPVRLSVGADGEPVVEVSRTGTELDAEGAAALFRPRQPGSGGGSKVGLFVAKGLTESQDGTLEVDTAGGIRFRVRLAPEARADR